MKISSVHSSRYTPIEKDMTKQRSNPEDWDYVEVVEDESEHDYTEY